MDQALKQWRAAGKHLPDVLKDFHDQKDIFRALHEMVGVADDGMTKDINFVTGQCYTIDCFLWFMARHGYTLQKSRANLPFESLADNVQACTDRRNALLANVLGGGAATLPSLDAEPQV